MNSRSSKSKIATMVVTAIGLLPACSSELGGPETRKGAVKREELVQRVTVAGMVAPRRKMVIQPTYNGYVRRIHVGVGDRVRQGDPIVSVAQVLAADAGDVYPLRAPFAGTVVQVLKSEGEYVETGKDTSALVRIDDLSQIFVEADVPEIELVKLRLGQEVLIKASALISRSYKGVIKQIALAAKEKKDWGKSTVEFPVRIEVTDRDESIRPGMSVMIDIIAARKPGVLTLRHEFIYKEGEKHFVRLTDGSRREIRIGLQNEETVEVLEGLKEGEEVRQADFLVTGNGA